MFAAAAAAPAPYGFGEENTDGLTMRDILRSCPAPLLPLGAAAHVVVPAALPGRAEPWASSGDPVDAGIAAVSVDIGEDAGVPGVCGRQSARCCCTNARDDNGFSRPLPPLPLPPPPPPLPLAKSFALPASPVAAPCAAIIADESSEAGGNCKGDTSFFFFVPSAPPPPLATDSEGGAEEPVPVRAGELGPGGGVRPRAGRYTCSCCVLPLALLSLRLQSATASSVSNCCTRGDEDEGGLVKLASRGEDDEDDEDRGSDARAIAEANTASDGTLVTGAALEAGTAAAAEEGAVSLLSEVGGGGCGEAMSCWLDGLVAEEGDNKTSSGTMEGELRWCPDRSDIEGRRDGGTPAPGPEPELEPDELGPAMELELEPEAVTSAGVEEAAAGSEEETEAVEVDTAAGSGAGAGAGPAVPSPPSGCCTAAADPTGEASCSSSTRTGGGTSFVRTVEEVGLISCAGDKSRSDLDVWGWLAAGWTSAMRASSGSCVSGC
jgi:hypothetical protein